MSEFLLWRICRRPFTCGDMIPTSHFIKARTEKEAISKMNQKFKACDFSSMSLFVILEGDK